MDSRWTPDFDSRCNQPVAGYATLSHSLIKSWSTLDLAGGHNFRTIATPNVRADGHPPIELLEEMEGSYRQRAEKVLRGHRVPLKLHRGATLAYEDVYGASPEYWNREGDWKLRSAEDIMTDPVVLRALEVAREKHGGRLISVALHLDEDSPHIHVVALALVQGLHATRGRKPKGCALDADNKKIDPRPKTWKWSLYASKERGLSSQLAKNHSDWAERCADLGLIRGADRTKMDLEESRAHKAKQTGRSSKLEAEARKRRDEMAAEAASLVTTARKEAAELVAQGAAEKARLQAEFNRPIIEADEQARGIIEGANALVLAAARSMDAARQEADRIGNESTVAGQLVRDQAVADANTLREQAEADAQAIKAQAETDAKAILDAADAEALRIRNAENARLQSERERLDRDKADARREKQEAAAARKAVDEERDGILTQARTDADAIRSSAEEWKQQQTAADLRTAAWEESLEEREERWEAAEAHVQSRTTEVDELWNSLSKMLNDASVLLSPLQEFTVKFQAAAEADQAAMQDRFKAAREAIESAEAKAYRDKLEEAKFLAARSGRGGRS
jgi:hypothetical protein